jgi:hypothetical protein
VDDIVQAGSLEVAEYKRGLSLREIVKGVVTRFLPASVVSLLGAVLGSATIGSGQLVPLMSMLIGWAAFVGLGFGVGLLALAKWLYPDAKVGGPRSILAGVLAPLLPLFFLWLNAVLDTGLGLGSWEWRALLVLAGMVGALAMYFPWLTATPPHMRDESGDLGHDRGAGKLPGGAR